MAISPTVFKTADKRLIVAPQVSGKTSIDPYFKKPSLWSISPTTGESGRIYENGSLIFLLDADIRTNATAGQQPLNIPASSGELGFIVDIEIPAGVTAQVFVAGHNYDARFYTSGRYYGSITLDSTLSVAYAFVRWFAGSSNEFVKVKEFFVFDASIFTYTDFLRSPNAILQYEQKNTRPEISRVLPRLGWTDAAPNELVVGRWLGNQLYYSEQLQQSANWKPSGMSITANAAVAPDGNTTADRLIAAGVGKMYQVNNFPSLATGPKCFSVWLKAVSGQVAVSLRLNNAGGATVKETIFTVDTNWKRYFITGSVTTTGCHAEISFSSATGIDVWGAQVVDGDVPGAYTLTTTALLPAGTKPANSPTPTEIPNSQAVVGDRLENAAWDGLFTTPIAWICVGPGEPGTWKAVYLFDALPATEDPYFYSFIGASGVWQIEQGSGFVMSPMSLVFNSGAAQAYLIQSNLSCCVPYELLTYSIEALAVAGGQIQWRPGDQNAINVGTPGIYVGDVTLAATVALPNQAKLGAASAGVTATLKSALVRPKYPFLTTAPSSFTGVPPNQVPANPVAAVPDTWYCGGTPPTYAAGVLSLIPYQPLFIRPSQGIVVGKTYRVRVNITTAGTVTTTLGLTFLKADGTQTSSPVTIDATTTGIKMITMVAPVDAIAIAIYSDTFGGGASFSIDYARFYSE